MLFLSRSFAVCIILRDCFPLLHTSVAHAPVLVTAIFYYCLLRELRCHLHPVLLGNAIVCTTVLRVLLPDTLLQRTDDRKSFHKLVSS
jgi:hypothetical protein